MRKVAAVAAVALMGLLTVGAADGQRRAGAVFTAVIQDTNTDFGRTVVLKEIRDRHGDTVGEAETVCVPVRRRSAQCIGTFILPKGKIMVAGTRRSQEFFVFAVTGGTGVYLAAGGELAGRTFDTNPRRERLLFSLVFP